MRKRNKDLHPSKKQFNLGHLAVAIMVYVYKFFQLGFIFYVVQAPFQVAKLSIFYDLFVTFLIQEAEHKWGPTFLKFSLYLKKGL